MQNETTITKEIESLELEEFNGETSGSALDLNDQKYLDVVKDVEIKLSAVLGLAHITVGELFRLKDGGVLSLDKLTTDPIELYLSGQLVAKGLLVVVNENFGVQLTEVCQL